MPEALSATDVPRLGGLRPSHQEQQKGLPLQAKVDSAPGSEHQAGLADGAVERRQPLPKRVLPIGWLVFTNPQSYWRSSLNYHKR